MHTDIKSKRLLTNILDISLKFEDREPHEIKNGMRVIIPAKLSRNYMIERESNHDESIYSMEVASSSE